MVAMSKAIRSVVEPLGALDQIPDDVLTDLNAIVGAYAADLRDELERRRTREHSH